MSGAESHSSAGAGAGAGAGADVSSTLKHRANATKHLKPASHDNTSTSAHDPLAPTENPIENEHAAAAAAAAAVGTERNSDVDDIGDFADDSDHYTQSSGAASCKDHLIAGAVATVVFFVVFSGMSYWATGSFDFGMLNEVDDFLSASFKGHSTTTDESALPMLTLEELKQYDGSDPSKPVYLSIMGQIYDVSAGMKHYGPKGSYHAFAGRDASRGFISGCFANERGHDLRGLTDKQLDELKDWAKFYREHKTYHRVATLDAPVNDDDPLPVDTC
jgi:predicted heme/steroid binding protein